AGAVGRDAVFVLTPQAERRPDLRPDGVAAALAAGDLDDPSAHAAVLMPHAARADEAPVVVRVGPCAHHDARHGARRRVMRSACGSGSRDRQPQRHEEPDSHLSHPPQTDDIEHLLIEDVHPKSGAMWLSSEHLQTRRGAPLPWYGMRLLLSIFILLA